jgi:nicotinamidase-related amidase
MPRTKRDWNQFVLLLIDVQVDFMSERLHAHFPDFTINVARLLSFCRDEGLEVVHLRARFKPDMSDWMARYVLTGHIPCVEGMGGEDPLPCARERPGERVIVKKTFDGFHDPALLPYLRGRGKRFVLTAGLVTSICVLFTSVSAAQLGFLAAVVEDCCAAAPAQHEQALDTYQFIFDRVTVDDVPERYAGWVADLKKLEAMAHPPAGSGDAEGDNAR